MESDSGAAVLLASRRSAQAPARGPAAVCSYHHPIRTETQHTRPLLVGRVCVESEPTALAAGTAGLKALAGDTVALGPVVDVGVSVGEAVVDGILMGVRILRYDEGEAARATHECEIANGGQAVRQRDGGQGGAVEEG